jgi:hypothetical protein
MEFRMHNSGLHYYDPRKEQHLTFVKTVSENKTGFTKRFLDVASSARRGTIIVVTRFLGTVCCWMPFLVALLTFLVLPVILIIGAGITAFSISTAASVTVTSSTVLCEGGALRMCHSCDHSFAILVQKMQSLLVFLGITIVSGGEIFMHPNPNSSTLTNEGI